MCAFGTAGATLERASGSMEGLAWPVGTAGVGWK